MKSIKLLVDGILEATGVGIWLREKAKINDRGPLITDRLGIVLTFFALTGVSGKQLWGITNLQVFDILHFVLRKL